MSATLLNPSHSWKVPTPTGLFFVGYVPLPLTLLESTPHLQGSFVSATYLNPSHSWRVQHTHRALLCQLRSLTPSTPGVFTTPTRLFCIGFVTYPLPLLESLPHPQGSFVSATFLNPSHSRKVHHTHRALFSQFYNAQKVHHTHRALLSWLCSLTPHTPHHIHMAFLFCL